MVYVTKDGSVHNEQPWGLDKIMSVISGVVNMVFSFFQTMLPIESSNPSSGARFRNSGGSGSGYRTGSSNGGNSRSPGSTPRSGGNIHGLGGPGAPPPPPPDCGSCCGM